MPLLQTIKKRADFVSVTDKGKRFITGTFILQMLARPETHPAGQAIRFGFTVTKKMGNAVIRNRIKRRLREAVKQTAPLHVLAGCDYVMVSRHKALECSFDVLLRDMEFAFSRISSMKDDKQKSTKHRP